jgi:ketosteroid isomerase-like protein
VVRTATALLACALLALAACGSGSSDRDDVEQTLRDFVTALNKRDADRFCDDLVTREFIEKQTFAKGAKALADCKRQLRQVKDLKVKLVRISSLSVKGDRARVKVVLSVQSQEGDQLYRLKKEDGGWRIASGSGG